MRKVVLFALLLLAVMSGAALAQDAQMPPVFCGDLSEDDCALLNQSQTAMTSLTSASVDLQLNLNVENLQGTAGQTNFALTGTGAYVGDPNAFSGLMMGSTEMMDSAMTGQAIVDALRGFDGQLNLSLVLPVEMVADANLPSQVNLDLLLVDGVGYINFDSLQPLLGQTGQELTGWGGLDIASFLEAVLQQQPDLFAGATGGLDANMIARLSDPSSMAGYVTITRVESSDDSIATFQTTFDFAAFSQDPAYQEALNAQLDAVASQQGTTLTDEERQQALDAAVAALEGLDMTLTQMIDTETGYARSTMINGAFDLSGLEMGTGDGATAPRFTFDLTVTLDQFNAVETINAPEDAAILPYEQLLGMGMGTGAMPMQPTVTPGS